jgi:hypothetical protein
MPNDAVAPRATARLTSSRGAIARKKSSLVQHAIVRAVDAPTPAQEPVHQEPPPYVYAAAEYRPVGDRDIELCREASHTDWVYIASLAALDAAAITADSQYFKTQPQPGVRLIAPALVGLTWGATLGGTYLSLPRCDPGYVKWAPPEGNVRTVTPLLFAIALFSVATAPFVANVSHGGIQPDWPIWERTMTVLLPIGTGFGGTFLPLLFPPRTYRAAKELENLRLGVDKSGAFSIGYHFTF